IEMTSSKQETQQKTILHFWEQGIRNAAEIHTKTKIPLRTIYNNLKKINATGDVKRKSGSGRIKKITPRASRSIGQFIRRQPTLSSKSIANKLKDIGINVTRSTVSRHLTSLGYRNALPLATPMLTQHWYKNARPIRPIPKDRSKIFAWGGFCVKGKTSLFCFRRIMDGKFYTEILEKHIPEDNDPKHTSRIAKEFLDNNSFLGEEWEKIPNNLLINLVNSMPQRCKEVIEKN
ncbi:12044_t:CDS:2, partial [Dentiscutata erythropus]